MLHLTARFHLELHMSTNEHQWVEISGMKVASKAMNHLTTDKTNQFLFHSKEKHTDISTCRHTVHIKSAIKLFLWKLYQFPCFLNGDNVYSLCIHIHLFRVNTLLMNILSCCIFQLEHLLAVSLLALQLLPWSHRPDTWPQWNCIKAQWECILWQWASTVGFKPLTLGQLHRWWATKTCVENIRFADREWGSSCQVLYKEGALHSSVLSCVWSHMTSGEGHVCLRTAVGNVLFTFRRSPTSHLCNIKEGLGCGAQKSKWESNPYIYPESSVFS